MKYTTFDITAHSSRHHNTQLKGSISIRHQQLPRLPSKHTSQMATMVSSKYTTGTMVTKYVHIRNGYQANGCHGSEYVYITVIMVTK